jgi:hypothetical protein
MALLNQLRLALSAFQWARGVKALGDTGHGVDGASIVDLIRHRQMPKRGTKALINTFNTSPRIRSVLDKISGSTATIPWQVFVAVHGKSFRQRRDIKKAGHEYRNKAIKAGLEAGDIEEVTPEDVPWLEVLYTWNDVLDDIQSQKVLQMHHDLKGEMFIQIKRVVARDPAMRLPAELWPVPSHWVHRLGSATEPYELRIDGLGTAVEVPTDDMIYSAAPDPLNPYGRGSGFGQSLADELDTDEYAAQYVRNFFGNSAVPPYIMSFLKGNEDVGKAFRTSWDQHHRGTAKAHRPEFIGGDFKVHEFNQSFDHKTTIELREFERNVINETFGIPPEVLGIIENSNRATIDTANYLFQSNVVVPRKETLRRFLQTKLIDPIEPRFILHYPDPVPEDIDRKQDLMKAAPYNYPIDEWQRAAGVPVDPDLAGVYRVPMNLMDVTAGSSKQVAMLPAKEIKGLSGSDIVRIADAADETLLTETLEPGMTSLIEVFGQQAIDDINLDGLAGFNIHSIRVQTFLRTWAATKIAGINDTTRGEIRRALAEGVRLGEGVDKLSRRLREVFTAAPPSRARTIATTEVNTGSNWSITEGHTQSGVVHKRQLVAARLNTRPSHLDIDQQIRSITAPFALISGANAGATAMSPGSFGIASEDINCHCTTIPLIDDPVTDAVRLDAVWKSFMSNKRQFENSMEQSVRDAFVRQEAAVLEALSRNL